MDGHDAAFVEDLGAEEATKFEANVFLRLAKRWERNRFGAFAYIGRNHLAQPGVSLDPDWKNDIVRVGIDGNVWAQRLNLYGVGMYGSNSNAIATPQQPEGTGDSQHFTGGFLQADYHASDSFALTARVNVVNRPDGLERGLHDLQQLRARVARVLLRPLATGVRVQLRQPGEAERGVGAGGPRVLSRAGDMSRRARA